MTDSKDDPRQIAEFLVRDNGVDQAMQLAHDGTTKAQNDGDNYALSVWREVKSFLRQTEPDPKVHKA